MAENIDHDLAQPYVALIEWQRSVSKTLDSMQKEAKVTAKISRAHAKHLDELNGTLKSLKTVQEITPKLQRITEQLTPEIIERVVGLAESKAEDEAFWKGLRKRLNPFKPVGLGIWFIFLASISGILVKIFWH